MSFLIYYGISVLGLIKRKSKVLTILILAVMLVMFAGVREIADYEVYQNRYMYVDTFSSFTEPLFTLFIRGIKAIGIDFYGFLVIAAILCIFPRCWVLLRLSNNSNIVLALYCVFPFFLDVCWIRMTMGITFIYLGLYCWLKNKKKNQLKSIMEFVVLVLVASGFHSGLLICLLLIVPEYFTTKKIILVTILCAVFLVVLTRNNRLFYIIANVVSAEKANIISSTAAYSFESIWMIYTIASILLLTGITYFFLNKTKNRLITLGNQSEKIRNIDITKVELVDYCIKINWILLAIIPLLPYSGSFYRIQLYMLPLFYCALSFYNKGTNSKLYRKEFLFFSAFIVCMIIVFYVYIGHTSIWNSVYLPFFRSNSIFH